MGEYLRALPRLKRSGLSSKEQWAQGFRPWGWACASVERNATVVPGTPCVFVAFTDTANPYAQLRQLQPPRLSPGVYGFVPFDCQARMPSSRMISRRRISRGMSSIQKLIPVVVLVLVSLRIMVSVLELVVVVVAVAVVVVGAVARVVMVVDDVLV